MDKKPVTQERRVSGNDTANNAGNTTNEIRRSVSTTGVQRRPSNSKFGSLTQSLLAKARSDGHGGSEFSPSEIQRLINPMRSQLGLPGLSLSPDSTKKNKEEESPKEVKLLELDKVLNNQNSQDVSSLSLASMSFNTVSDVIEELENSKTNADSTVIKGNEDKTLLVTLCTNNSNSNDDSIEKLIDAKPETSSCKISNRTYISSGSESDKLSPTSDSHKQNLDIAAVISGDIYGHLRKAVSSGQLETPVPPSTNGRLPQRPTPSTASKSSAKVTQKIKDNKKPPSGWKFPSETVQGKDYLVIKSLGKGGSGEVSLVIEKETRKLFALKKVCLAGIDDSSIQECINEVELLVDLKDTDLVIHIYAWEMHPTTKTMRIVMEHGHCDLNASIKSANATLVKLKSIWEQILLIVDIIHKRGIVHADLKPANFVWVGGTLKIIDFGIASRIQTDHTSIAMLNPKGTLNFISPETIRPDALGRGKISPKSDIWSLGCILYLMVYGKTPFQDYSHIAAKMNAIANGLITFPPLPPQIETSNVIQVLKLCLNLDSKLRPTTSALLQHSFLRGENHKTSLQTA